MTVLADKAARSATLIDVGMRDGLQSVPHVLPTDKKIEILFGLLEAGFTSIEVTSFAHPRVLPQFADALDVIRAAPSRDDVTYRALVPNLKGAQRAVDTDINEIVVVIPVDETMAAKNQNTTPQRLITDLHEIVRIAHAAGKKTIVGVATAFFAPTVGPVALDKTLDAVTKIVNAGADGYYLAGTTGLETPQEFSAGIAAARRLHPDVPVGVHVHNRNGFGLVSALESHAAGAAWIEGSFGGLGGDLWFPGDPDVLGNVALEDVVNLFESYGIATGIDLKRYLDVARSASGYTRIATRSYVGRGGTRAELAAEEWPDD